MPYVYFPQRPQRPPNESGGLLIGVLVLLGLPPAAYGFAQALNWSFASGLLAAGLLLLLQMFFLRRRTSYERAANNGWNAKIAFLLCALLFDTFAAFGLWQFSNESVAAQPALGGAGSLRQTHQLPVGWFDAEALLGARRGWNDFEWFIHYTTQGASEVMICWVLFIVFELLILLILFQRSYDEWS